VTDERTVEPVIEARVSTAAIRSAYDRWSRFYGVVARFERGPRLRGLELAEIQGDDRVLEVAVGTGASLLEILGLVNPDNSVTGVDLSDRMLERSRRAVTRAGHRNVELHQADARDLPFADGSFDVVINSYMLDLIPLADIPVVLGEFRRILADDGRLVMVNMSRGRRLTRWEKLYRATPPRLVPYLFGGCRPVLVEQPARDAGFRHVEREFITGAIPSEVVVAHK
jgi:demethylmenaquinone methyltransferase/2-methoxy-6-polyprenyl-1,4-benzoquinol methylase